MRQLYSNLLYIVLTLAFFQFKCSIPTDPSKDPDNLTVTFKLPGNSNAVAQGSEVLVGLVINYPVHADSIKVSFGELALKETVLFCQTKSTQAETLYVKCRYTEENAKTITVTVRLTKGTYKTFFQSINVFPKSLSVSFAAIQQTYLVQINEPITLQFPASSDPTGNAIDFRVISNPPLDSTALKMVDEGTSARVTATCTSLQPHKITCYANSSTKAFDSVDVTIVPYIKPSLSSTSGSSVIQVGTSDTLLITVPEDQSGKLSISSLDSLLINRKVISVVPLQSDTLKIVFTPNEVKTYTFTFLVKKDSLSDTITIQKTVSDTPVSIWKLTSATTGGTEGKQLSYPLSTYFTDSSRNDIMLVSSKGTISNKILNYTIPWGSSQKDSILISAIVNGAVSQFKLFLNVSSADSSTPKLKMITPAANPFKTSESKATCKIVASDSGAGIAAVIFTKDGIVISDTTRTDSLYQCKITNLVNGVPAILKIVVTDASMKKNKDSITLIIIRDSTIEDMNPPIFSVIADPRQNGRVTVDTGTIKVSIEDGSGIADNSEIIKLNGTTITGITRSGETYSIPYSLKNYGLNTILIKASDNSASKNSDSITINIDYNTKISAINAVAPKTDSTNVILLPTFSWSGGDDADKDTVFYKVFYGTDSSTLISQTSGVTHKSVPVPTALLANRKYFWKVIGYTTKYPDTIRSQVMRFTTLNNDNSGPLITIKSGATNGSRVKEVSGSIVLTITDPNGMQDVGAKLNGTLLTGVTSSGSDYTIHYTLSAFGNNTIVITTKDNSPDHNGSTLGITFTYNTSPSLLTLVSPVDNAQEIDTLPIIKWTGGTDEDRDSVFFKVFYGVSAAALNTESTESPNVNAIRLSTKLNANTTCYWKVIGYTKGSYKDTVTLGPYSFKTVNPDRTTPTITLQSPASYTSNMRLTNGSGTITFTATDIDGIDSVFYKINNGNNTALSGSGPQYSFTYNLTVFGINTIKLYAIDKSSLHNKDSLTLTFTYNTTPAAVKLQTPANETANVDTLPTFTWTDGDDADSDQVSYRVVYGTLATSLTNQSPVVTAKTVTLTNSLSPNRIYYWKVMMVTKGAFNDTLFSGLNSFFTVNPDRTSPILTVTAPPQYTAGMRVTSATSSNVTFTASDTSGIDSAYYTVNASGAKTMVTGTGGTYAFSYTLTRRGLDTITIYVVDRSSLHNKTTAQIIVNYNTAPVSPSFTTNLPANNAVEIPRLASFNWTALSDEDNDSIYYNVEYSASQDFSNSTVSHETSSNALTLQSGKELLSNTCYWYRVIGFTKLPFRDTVRSSSASFTTHNLVPTVSANAPSNGAIGIDPSTGTLSFTATDPENGILTYSVSLSASQTDILASQLRVNNLQTGSLPLSTFGTLQYTTHYYWQIIVTDNGSIPKSDTSDVYSFYTSNRAPVWSTIASEGSHSYQGSIDLSQFCSDPDGQGITYSLISTSISTSNGTINGNVLQFRADSQLITIWAKDNYTIQPCSSTISFRRWFVNTQMKMIPAKGASFQMGTDESLVVGESYYETSDPPPYNYMLTSTPWGDGSPVHTVNFTNDFFMDSTEITQIDYSALLNVNPSTAIGNIIPVNSVTWFDALLYCNARSKRDGLDTVYTYTAITGTAGNGCSGLSDLSIIYLKNGYRLPTEAEWEFSCRAGTTTKNYWPDSDDNAQYANRFFVDHNIITSPIIQVATLKPNKFNLYDMIGNVAEWCNDWYGIYGNTTQTDPIGPSTGYVRVSRGSYSTWDNSIDEYRPDKTITPANSAFRNSSPEGFRCVRVKR